mgnify:CR=1 FL=1
MGCLSSKNSNKEKLLIRGSHEEHHIKLKDAEKASQVHVVAGVHQLKQTYDIDKSIVGKGAFGKVNLAIHRLTGKFVRRRTIDSDS